MKKTILLVHGWNYALYNSTGANNPWKNRAEFLKGLEELFHVHVVKLPGFCGIPEPNTESWNTADYADWLYEYIQKTGIVFDYFFGYSFGCPVIAQMSLKHDMVTPCILISPALRRGESTRSRLAHMFSWIPAWIRDPLREVYLGIVSPYFKYGTEFLRNSYKIIVREDSVDSALLLSQKVPLYCIYGTADTATPVQIVLDELSHNNIKLYTIMHGGHNIAVTHTKEVLDIVRSIVVTTD
jgi:pimeloyl-ACP methyl ester carboxylesterase